MPKSRFDADPAGDVQRRLEGLDLAGDRRVTGLVGVGEVAPDTDDLDLVALGRGCHQRRPLRHISAVARQAGVDLQVDVGLVSGIAGRLRYGPQRPDVADADINV